MKKSTPNSEYKGIIKERLKEALTNAEMTQVELADRIGVSTASISHWINGINKPDSPNLRKIAKTLNVSEGWLLGDDTSGIGYDRKRLEQKVEICDIVECFDGSTAREVVRRMLDLNLDGQKRILEEVELLLQSPKYRKNEKREESSEKKAM